MDGALKRVGAVDGAEQGQRARQVRSDFLEAVGKVTTDANLDATVRGSEIDLIGRAD